MTETYTYRDPECGTVGCVGGHYLAAKAYVFPELNLIGWTQSHTAQKFAFIEKLHDDGVVHPELAEYGHGADHMAKA